MTTKSQEATPTQIAEWREAFEAAWPGFYSAKTDGVYDREGRQSEWEGYLRARTEQSTEITELKAKLAGAEAEVAALKQGLHRADEKLAEVMPLAKFGAMTMNGNILMYHKQETITDAISCGLLVDDAHHGDTIYGVTYAPSIEATIEQLLKD